MTYKNNINCKYLDNIYVNFLSGSFTHCWAGWKSIDYVPQYNKFLLPTDGEGEIVVNNIKYHLVPGNIYLMPAETKQSFYHISDNFVTKYWFHFSAKLGNMNLFNLVHPRFCIKLDDDGEHIKNLFIRLIDLTNQEETVYNTVAIKGLILEIISFYLKMDSKLPNDGTQQYETDFRNVLQYIEKNMEKKLTINELADVMHLHPNYFIRYFKSFFGSSPIKFINNMRMNRAKQLLSEENMSISQISKSVGIGDIFYFSKLFKKYNGFAPTEYKHKI